MVTHPQINTLCLFPCTYTRGAFGVRLLTQGHCNVDRGIAGHPPLPSVVQIPTVWVVQQNLRHHKFISKPSLMLVLILTCSVRNSKNCWFTCNIAPEKGGSVWYLKIWYCMYCWIFWSILQYLAIIPDSINKINKEIFKTLALELQTLNISVLSLKENLFFDD